jgi:ketosteroid isomerase-like protein
VSEANVKLTEDFFAAYNRGGTEAMLEYYDPDAELVAPPEWPEERVLWGHDGVRQIVANWEEQFDDFRIDLDKVTGIGENSVLALFIICGRIKGSDREVVQPTALHLEFRGGKVTRWHAYFSWEEALRAAGLEA